MKTSQVDVNYHCRFTEICALLYHYDSYSGIIEEWELQDLLQFHYRERLLHQLEWDLLCAREWVSIIPDSKYAQDNLDNCKCTLEWAFIEEYDSLDTRELVTGDDLAVRLPPPLQLSHFIR